MSVSQILQVIVIVTDTLADATVGSLNKDKVAGAVSILGMLENTLMGQENGGMENENENA